MDCVLIHRNDHLSVDWWDKIIFLEKEKICVKKSLYFLKLVWKYIFIHFSDHFVKLRLKMMNQILFQANYISSYQVNIFYNEVWISLTKKYQKQFLILQKFLQIKISYFNLYKIKNAHQKTRKIRNIQLNAEFYFTKVNDFKSCIHSSRCLLCSNIFLYWTMII